MNQIHIFSGGNITELYFIYNFVLGKTVLVVLVAKHPIFYQASLFFLHPYKQLFMFA